MSFDYINATQAERAAYDAGRQAGISAVPDAEGPRKLNVLDEEINMLRSAIWIYLDGPPSPERAKLLRDALEDTK